MVSGRQTEKQVELRDALQRTRPAGSSMSLNAIEWSKKFLRS